MSLNKEFVSYEQALALKELGFCEDFIGYFFDESYREFGVDVIRDHQIKTNSYDPRYTPLKSQVFRWFMEKHNLRGFIGFRPNVNKFDYHVYDMSLSGTEYVKKRTMEEFNKDPKVGTFEEAESGCIDKLIEIVKQK